MNYNKNEIFETLSKIALMILLFIALMIITLGIELDFSKLLTLSYWATVATQLAFVMIVFNLVTTSHSRTKARNENGRFYLAYATNMLRIKEIEENNRYDDLSEAVKMENEENYKRKCNEKIHSITSRFGYDEIMKNIDNLDNLFLSCKINGKQAKRLKKIVDKVIAGSYCYTQIKDIMFLRDKELVPHDKSMIAFNVAGDKIKGNTKRIITFLVPTIILNIIAYHYSSIDFWTWFLTNSTLCISAVVSGLYEAQREIRLRTAMYEERNAFLKRRLNINTVYKTEN